MLIKFDQDTLSETDSNHLVLWVTSEGMKIAQRIIRSRLVKHTFEIGTAVVDVKDGTEGSKAEIEIQSERAVKYKNFLEVIDELKVGKQTVEKLKIV